jgi:hypothetical protein
LSAFGGCWLRSALKAAPLGAGAVSFRLTVLFFATPARRLRSRCAAAWWATCPSFLVAALGPGDLAPCFGCGFRGCRGPACSWVGGCHASGTRHVALLCPAWPVPVFFRAGAVSGCSGSRLGCCWPGVLGRRLVLYGCLRGLGFPLFPALRSLTAVCGGWVQGLVRAAGSGFFCFGRWCPSRGRCSGRFRAPRRRLAWLPRLRAP